MGIASPVRAASKKVAVKRSQFVVARRVGEKRLSRGRYVAEVMRVVVTDLEGATSKHLGNFPDLLYRFRRAQPRVQFPARPDRRVS